MDGEPFTIKNKKGEAVPMTLIDAAAEALLWENPQSPSNSTDKLKRGSLANHIFRKKNVELSIEEVALLKTRVGECGLIASCAAVVHEMLEDAGGSKVEKIK